MDTKTFLITHKQHLVYAVLGLLLLVSLGFNIRANYPIYAAPTLTASQSAQIASQSAIVSASISANTAQCHAVPQLYGDTQAYAPDKNCTPGVINPAVTQANIQQTICKTGYTTSLRNQKPESYFEDLKKEQIKLYGYKDTNPANYEEDHLVSLELGGANDPKNLWPEPGKTPNEKDKVEAYLHTQVCNGGMGLEEAQIDVSQSWYAVYLGIKNK